MTKREVPDMTDEDIYKAAWAIWDSGKFGKHDVVAELFRAGMEAGRAEAAAKPMRRKADSCTVERPDCVDAQTWADWLALRKSKKAAVTQTVLNAAWREAAKAAMTLEAFLQVWCFRGSQGLEAAWLTPQERGSGPGPNGPAPESSRAREARERVERVAPGAARKTVHPLVADADRIWCAVTGGADDAGPKRIG